MILPTPQCRKLYRAIYHLSGGHLRSLPAPAVPFFSIWKATASQNSLQQTFASISLVKTPSHGHFQLQKRLPRGCLALPISIEKAGKGKRLGMGRISLSVDETTQSNPLENLVIDCQVQRLRIFRSLRPFSTTFCFLNREAEVPRTHVTFLKLCIISFEATNRIQ